jgi:hypothetical protein
LGDFKIVIDELDDEDFRVGEIEKIVYSEQDVSFNSYFLVCPHRLKFEILGIRLKIAALLSYALHLNTTQDVITLSL